ncbi:LOW QUALITY PROTEIN: hypothetical protein QC762_604015 [Podospora pseudocomata]|uniref:Uncharacterized protein n=1 Tax=Podospora pseudocomata TaxID=2093779 RepID=A0ABR0G607_9PEZI|nr:LOW QUALITY PROTEIN: hypothetical protein QC762_604015 [Podospora pseudocomata]
MPFSQLPAVHGTCVLTLSSHALELLWAQTTIPLASGKSAEPVRWDSEMVHPGPKKGDNGFWNGDSPRTLLWVETELPRGSRDSRGSRDGYIGYKVTRYLWGVREGSPSPVEDFYTLRVHFRFTHTFTMIVRESEPHANFGRGAYDTTGVPKPPPPKPR